MTGKDQLGLYWGPEALYFIETAKDKVVTAERVALDLTTHKEDAADILDGPRFSGLIQKALHNQGIVTTHLNLCLPSRELVFRSFVIPPMQADEIKNVVSFEVTKYIPIKLDELVYTYHVVPATENNQKNLRILFVAIRKDTLHRYTSILEHSGLQAQHIEPAFVTLVRALTRQRIISSRHSSAVIKIEQGQGEIIFVDNDVVQFVREFNTPADHLDNQAAQANILSDIRVSFDYYARQNPQSTIDKIILISNFPLEGLAAGVSEEIGKAVLPLISSDVLKNQEGGDGDIGMLSAYGCSIREPAFSTKDFDLSERAARIHAQMADIQVETRIYKVMGGVALVCALIICATVMLSNHMVMGLKQRVVQLRAQQGQFKNMPVNDIKERTVEINKKLASYRDIRISSDVSALLLAIPPLLPDGTWLSTLRIGYAEKKIKEGDVSRTITNPNMILEGYAHLQNVTEQFRIANTLVARLKGDAAMGNLFDNFELETIRQEKIEGYAVTYFKINCQ